MNTPKTLHALGVVLVAGATACATTPPSANLYDARQAQTAAKESEAPELAPDLMVDAEAHLQKAEKAYEEDPQGEREKHYAYLATRTYQRAQTEADRAQSKERTDALRKTYVEANETMRRRSQKRLQALEAEYARTNEALRDARQDASTKAGELAELEKKQADLQARTENLRTSLAATAATLNQKDETLEAERARRKEAEAEAERARKELEKIAKVVEEDGETRITLSGEILFEFGKSTLLPSAKRRLQAVASVLSNKKGSGPINVVGHTDAKGPDEFNLKLSRDRARAVRDFLVSAGVDSARLEAMGRGETQPIASNDSPEGRANNRRVEIVIPNPAS